MQGEMLTAALEVRARIDVMSMTGNPPGGTHKLLLIWCYLKFQLQMVTCLYQVTGAHQVNNQQQRQLQVVSKAGMSHAPGLWHCIDLKRPQSGGNQTL